MKKLLLYILVVFAAKQAAAQQQHQYTQFMYNKLFVNPAYAGARGTTSFTGIYRNQWAGFDGAPKSVMASVNTPFFSDRVGLGVTLSHVKIGLNSDFAGTMAYAYDLVNREDLSFRVGLSATLRSLGIDFTKAKPKPGSGPFGDNSLNDSRTNDVYGNVGAGIFGTFMQQFYVGFAVPRIYSNAVGYKATQNNDPTAKESQHFYGQAGAILPIGKDLKFMPAILVKYVKNAPVNADINFNLDVREKFTAGLSYRTGGDGSGDSVDLLAFWQATPQLGIGAAYDFSLSKIRDYNSGSFEVLVQYELKKSTKKKGMTNPRFFM